MVAQRCWLGISYALSHSLNTHTCIHMKLKRYDEYPIFPKMLLMAKKKEKQVYNVAGDNCGLLWIIAQE